jgi:23S rRNA (cytosine1962-C5)-methyltransferase
MTEKTDYVLVDSGDGRKLERFGPYLLSRPCSQAVWRQKLPDQWILADGSFSREQENKWSWKRQLPLSWTLESAGIAFKISPTDFGHLGIFPEQLSSWKWIQEVVKSQVAAGSQPRILNLFAYSGGSTLAAAKAGASVCHLDASKGMVTWARENTSLNKLEKAPIRWIVEDVKKFLYRELKRGSRYEGIILDPPTFGRGAKGEIFKIENEIVELLDDCKRLLSQNPLFTLFSCHTPGFSPLVMQQLLMQSLEGFHGSVDAGEMVIEGQREALSLPSGTFARWMSNK